MYSDKDLFASLNKKMKLGNPAFMRVSGLLSCVLSTDDSPKQRNLSHDYKGYKPDSYKKILFYSNPLPVFRRIVIRGYIFGISIVVYWLYCSACITERRACR